MDESKISVRYAKALLSLSKEKQVTEEIKIDIDTISQLFDTFPGFTHMLQSPVIKSKEKEQFFEKVFAKSIHKLTYSFLMLLLTNHREAYLRDITRNFLASYRKEKAIKRPIW